MMENNFKYMAERTFRQAIKTGRDDPRDILYKDLDGMDDMTKERHTNHMKSAHHKFMARHHKKKMYKK